jgi:hypothetical protein
MLNIAWAVKSNSHLSKGDIIAGPAAKFSAPNVQVILWLCPNLA